MTGTSLGRRCSSNVTSVGFGGTGSGAGSGGGWVVGAWVVGAWVGLGGKSVGARLVVVVLVGFAVAAGAASVGSATRAGDRAPIAPHAASTAARIATRNTRAQAKESAPLRSAGYLPVGLVRLLRRPSRRFVT